jgi:hypothetical protein
MKNNYEKLRALNIEIGRAETRGDKQFFKTLLAPHFAMHRASGEFEDRKGFIADVKRGDKRVTEIRSITFFEANCALVSCVVTMETAKGTVRFHNARLFTRRLPDMDWQLLAWANERMT